MAPNSDQAISPARGGRGGGGAGAQTPDPASKPPPPEAGLGAGPPPRLQPPQEPCCDDCSHVGASSCPRGRSPPHPHLRRAVEAGTPRLAKLPPPLQGESPQPLSPCAPRLRPHLGWGRGGRGRRRPAAVLPGSATPLLWQPFPSEPVAARARLWLPRSLAPSLSLPPFLPPYLRSGLGEGLAGAGVRGGDPGPERGAARGEGLSPGSSSSRAPGPPGLSPPRYSRAQASSSSSSSWLGASGAGPADRAPGRGGGGGGTGKLAVARRRLRALG